MKWIIEVVGFEAFRALYEKELAAIRAAGGRPVPEVPPEETAPTHRPVRAVEALLSSPQYVAWKQQSARPQAQAGYVSAVAWLKLGDISSAQMRELADLVEKYGDGTVRTTLNQNLLVRWIRSEELAGFYQGLAKAGLGEPHADTVRDVVACPGAETCKLAVTASRGIGQLIAEHLTGKQLSAAAMTTDIKVSGCPNGCAQNHVSAIGLQGGIRKVAGQLVPQYHLTIGGGVDRNGAQFGRLVAKLPARRVPEAIDRLISHYDKAKLAEETPRAFFQRLSADEARTMLADLGELTETNVKPEDFIDLGSTVAFEVVKMDGECAS
jgi:sulfite reductase (ferredoxin)